MIEPLIEADHVNLPWEVIAWLFATAGTLGMGIWRQARMFQHQKDEAEKAREDRLRNCAHHALIMGEDGLNIPYEKVVAAEREAGVTEPGGHKR